MGLDVYLYRYNDFEKHQKLEAQAEAIGERMWSEAGDYNELTDEQREALRAKIDRARQATGLRNDDCEKIEIDSRQYPDHMFKIGYMRSSYNSGGINSILRNFIGRDLYYAFCDGVDGEYAFKPNWEQAKERCAELLQLFQEACEKLDDCYIHEQADFNAMFGRRRQSEIQSEKDALKLFEDEYERVKSQPREGGEPLNYGPFEVITLDMNPHSLARCPIRSQADLLEYWNLEDEHITRFDEPVKVRAIISATTYTSEQESRFNSGKFVYSKPVAEYKSYVIVDRSDLPQPEYGGGQWDSGWWSGRGGTFMMSDPPKAKMLARTFVTEPRWNAGAHLFMAYASDSDEGSYSYYKKSLEIAHEMCEWVLDREECDQYVLHWSA